MEGGGIGRHDRCAPTTADYNAKKGALRKRSGLLPRIINAIDRAALTDEELLAMPEKRQAANIDLYTCVLLADQIITEAWLDGYEAYKGELDMPIEEGFHHGLYLAPKGGESAPEENALYEERMVTLAQACNEVIRRHRNTPYAVAARWLQQGPQQWGKPIILTYVKGKHGAPGKQGPRGL